MLVKKKKKGRQKLKEEEGGVIFQHVGGFIHDQRRANASHTSLRGAELGSEASHLGTHANY